jgi:hypothetical protein
MAHERDAIPVGMEGLHSVAQQSRHALDVEQERQLADAFGCGTPTESLTLGACGEASGARSSG